jgi:hypothetical protein
MPKAEFLLNIRTARGLLTHQVTTDDPRLDPKTVEGQLARAAIWLTPGSVRGFDVRDFGELSPERRGELRDAVEQFRQVADQVPLDRCASPEQIRAGMAAFRKALEIVGPYLPELPGIRQVEEALQRVRFPDFVVNWNFEVCEDSTGEPAVRVHVFVRDEVADRKGLIKETNEIDRRIRVALDDAGVARWPYVRFRTASEQRSLEDIAK